jgi:CRP-like cAMP-binding protein
MHEPLPSLRRLFALRQFATFANVDLAELAVLADNVSEQAFAPGAEVAPGDTRLGALHLVLDGRIESRTGGTLEAWGPRDVFGMLEVLAGRPILAPAISTVETHTLQLRAHDTYEILEDNFGVLHAVIRGLAGRLAVADRTTTPATESLRHRLTLVERVIVLRQQLPFADGRLQPLAALAQGCEEVAWPAGTKITSTSQVADGFMIVLDGTLRAIRGGGQTQLLQPGDSIGALEALAGIRHRYDVETTLPVKGLRCSAATIVDVLEDHTDLGLVMVGNFARALLDARPVEHEMHSYLS